MASSIYLWSVTEEFSPFTGSFLGLGLFVVMVATCSFCLRGSTFRLSIYILILLILTLAQVTTTVLFIVKRDQFLDWAAKNLENDDKSFDKAREEIESDVDMTRYILIAISSLTVLVFIFAIFYRCSVVSGRMEHNEKMLKNDRYEKMSHEIDQAHKRKEEKKKEFHDKYNINTNAMT